MLLFLKKIFGAKPAEPTATPYKVEGPNHFPFPKSVAEGKPTAPAKQAAAPKKITAKKKTTKSSQQ